MNRRRFLKAGLGSSALIASTPLASAQRLNGGRGQRRREAKNIIFLVSDGMSSGTLAVADHYIRWRDGRPSNWIRLYEEGKGKRGLMDVASLDSLVTDSAAAAAAWGCGYRVNNGSVNIGPDGEEYPPILMLARAAGKATGLVTTATVTHATPAGFAANVPNRGQEQMVAQQYYEREYDVLLGGGRHIFSAAHREDKADLKGQFEERGHQYVQTRAELEAAAVTSGRLLGLFGDGHLPYDLDRLHDQKLLDDVPTLAEMARHALQHLSLHADGFVVQIEGAKVDMAAHSNDIGGLLFDQIAFDEAIQVAVEFSERNPDTLVILTTDHGNANPGMSTGAAGRDGGAKVFEALSQFGGTHGLILSRIRPESSVGEIQAVLREVTHLPFTAGEAEILHARLNNTYRMAYDRMNAVGSVLGQIIANHTEINWMSNTHTSDYVELLAWGPGSERIQAFNRNTDLFTLMLESAAIPAPARR